MIMKQREGKPARKMSPHFMKSQRDDRTERLCCSVAARITYGCIYHGQSPTIESSAVVDDGFFRVPNAIKGCGQCQEALFRGYLLR